MDGGNRMDIHVGDHLLMKKPHPCGGNRFSEGRVGMDFRIRCETCGREVMVPRAKVEKNIRRVVREGRELTREELERRPNAKLEPTGGQEDV